MDKKTEMPDLLYIGDGRLICTVLEEMRDCCKHLNFSPMLSLIEEVQILANRMENGLDLKGGLDRIQKDHRELKKTRKVLVKEVEALIKMRDGFDETDHGDDERGDTDDQTSSQGLPLGA